MPRIALLTLSFLFVSGCSAIVGGKLDKKDAEPENTCDNDGGACDAGAGAACQSDEDCVVSPTNTAGPLSCMARCTNNVCDFASPSPDGTYCGSTIMEVDMQARICVGGACTTSTCGDAYVDRVGMPPEFCDQGMVRGEIDDCGIPVGGTINTICSKPCGAWASSPPGWMGTSFPVDCGDNGNPCDGLEECSLTPPPGADGRICIARDVPAEGSACGAGGTCVNHQCVGG